MELNEIIANVLKIDKNTITDETSPKNCENWTSLNHLILIKEINKNYNIKLSFAEIKTIKNVSDIKNLLKSKGIYNE